MVRVDFVTLFPEMVLGVVSQSILGRAARAGLAEFHAVNPRDYTYDRHRTVDDTPFGGAPGMVLKPEPVAMALESLALEPETPVIVTDAAGERFTQAAARELAAAPRVAFICGHYEGMDERIRTKLANRAYSIGDFVLTGGELPALAMADAIVRLVPGVLGDPASHQDDSHTDGLLGFPLYTRPVEFMGESVPPVLLSGDHGAIAKWRRQQCLRRTRQARPDLFCRADLKRSDVDML